MPIVAGLLLVAAGGILPLFFRRNLAAARIPALAGMGGGSLVGLWGAMAALAAPQPLAFSCRWLGLLQLDFRIDPLSAFFLICIFAISLLAVLYSFHYLDNPAKSVRTVISHLLLAVLVIAMALVVCAGNLIALALAWELMSISSGLLVLYDYELRENRQAGYVYFIFTQAGALFLFAAFGLLFAHTGGMALAGGGQLSAGVKLAVFLLALIGFGSKAGVVPLHIWLPQAHPAAPSHISALMSGIMIKMGIYGLLRFYLILAPLPPLFGRIVLVLGILSGLVGVAHALAQHHLKKLLAFHSVENIGIILIGLGFGMLALSSGHPVLAFWSFTGALLHVLNHALFKSLLFFGAGAIQHSGCPLEMEQLGGLMKRMYFTGCTFLVGSLAICGLPPFNGFVSELLIYVSAFQGSRAEGADFLFAIGVVVALAVIGGLAVACFTKVVGIVFLGEPRSAAPTRAHECGPAMRLAMAVPALACLLIGVLPILAVAPVARVVAGLPGMRAPELPGLAGLCWGISQGALVFLAGAALVFLVRQRLYAGKPVTAAATWGCGFTRGTPRIQYTATSFAAPVIGFFKALVPIKEHYTGLKGLFPEAASYESHLDNQAENLAVNGVARPILRLAQRLHWIQHGSIQFYILYIVVAIILAALLIACPEAVCL
jgi:hydrogenase-4 component B